MEIYLLESFMTTTLPQQDSVLMSNLILNVTIQHLIVIVL